MRFRYGPPPEDEAFHPKTQGWSGIREPGPLILNVLVFPVGILLAFAIIYAISLVWEGGPEAIMEGLLEQSVPNPFLIFLIVVVISLPVHELVHLFVHPEFGRSDKSILGLWLSRGLFYAHYEDAISRNRFLSILIAPYLVLGWIPVILLAFVGNSVPIVYVEILIIVGLTNCVLPAGDVIGFFLLLSQVPTSACVKNKGWRSYWKKAVACGE